MSEYVKDDIAMASERKVISKKVKVKLFREASVFLKRLSDNELEFLCNFTGFNYITHNDAISNLAEVYVLYCSSDKLNWVENALLELFTNLKLYERKFKKSFNELIEIDRSNSLI